MSQLVYSGESPEETADNWIRKFREWESECVGATGKEMLSFDGKNLKVDWGIYFRLNYNRDKNNKILKDAGIFSFNPVNNWEIVGSGHLNLNPWSQGGKVYYFTREEDVIAYARLKYCKAIYNWHIQKIACVISGLSY